MGKRFYLAFAGLDSGKTRVALALVCRYVLGCPVVIRDLLSSVVVSLGRFYLRVFFALAADLEWEPGMSSASSA